MNMKLGAFRTMIPPLTALESDPPAVFISRLALREGNYKKPIYQIHKWWARRLGSVFRSILIESGLQAGQPKSIGEKKFYERNDLSGLVVLDPFMGGGTSVVEAAKCNANVIGVDIDPVACFVTRKELESIDESALISAFEEVKKKVKERILHFYRTKLSDGREADIVYTFWVDLIICPKCKTKTPAHPHFQLYRNRSSKKQTVFCRHCDEIAFLPIDQKTFHCGSCGNHTEIQNGCIQNGVFSCPNCEEAFPLHSLVSRKKPPEQEMFALEVLVGKERLFKKADSRDRKLFVKARRNWNVRTKTERFVPNENIPLQNRADIRPLSYGYNKYRDLFNARQLLSLSLIAEAISSVRDKKSREFLAIAFSDSLASNNMFCFYAFDYRKLTPLFGIHAYRKVTRPVENNVWGTKAGRGSFEKCFNKLLRGKHYGAKTYEYRYDGANSKPERIFTGEKIAPEILKTIKDSQCMDNNRKKQYALLLNRSSESLKDIRTKSVDVILSDPPYYDNLAYSELSDFYHVWLRRLKLNGYSGNAKKQTPLKESLYVNRAVPDFENEHLRYANGLRSVLQECHRVLKDSGIFVFTFHHKDWLAWSALGSGLLKSSFKITNIFPVRSEGKSQFHSASGNLKWDVVFCCRKNRVPRTKLDNIDLDAISTCADQLAKNWAEDFEKDGLDFPLLDQKSLALAHILKEMCNAGLDPATVKTSLFAEISKNKKHRTI